MHLKKLTLNRLITIDYYTNGSLRTFTGRVYRLNVFEQIISLKDEKHQLFTIPLSGIRQIY
ncbi:YolD-like family protein [Bacillus sp. T33-2]|uniref:YolD-like family protein n=1 Tax=Bacillus sp. T33-2 TaxID=2054168 RepID=UPI000C78C714|nr:YolD-like family protein [Bacillus sp. T33-2]PLR98436.1 hypothetical protein CVD19_04965 [Bacillus sp. T33-2]